MQFSTKTTDFGQVQAYSLVQILVTPLNPTQEDYN